MAYIWYIYCRNLKDIYIAYEQHTQRRNIQTP